MHINEHVLLKGLVLLAVIIFIGGCGAGWLLSHLF